MKSWIFAALAVAMIAADPPQNQPASDPVIDCKMASTDSLDMPSSDPGILLRLFVSEGQPIVKGTELALVDDREAQAKLLVAENEYAVARQKADSTYEVRAAEKGRDVARTTYEKLKRANERSANAVADIDLILKKFEWERAELQIEKAAEDQESAKMVAISKAAERDAAKVAADRRRLIAPFDGVIVTVHKHPGEWLSPGDKVVEIVRIDRLHVNGRVPADKWAIGDLQNRKVTVEVKLPRGQTKRVDGRIVYVSPVVSPHGELTVRAEIDVPIEDGRPLVVAGQGGKMTIHVNQRVAAEAGPGAAPRLPANVK